MDNTPSNITLWAIIVGWITTAVGWMIGVGRDSAKAKRTSEYHSDKLKDHEARVRELEHATIASARDTAEMKTDVKWIKQHLDDSNRTKGL
jgi:5-carboxymethyl-2-hydroxymuconate isomerase